MASKIGIEGQVPTPELAALIRSAGWADVKMVGDTSMLAVAQGADIPIRILREYGTDDMAPADAANRIFTYDLSPVTHVQLLCETSKAWDAQWQADFRDALYSRGWRGVVMAMDTATGNPAQFDDTTHPPDHHFPLLQQIAPIFVPGALGKTAGASLPTWLGIDGYFPYGLHDPQYPAWVPWDSERATMLQACLSRHTGRASVPTIYLESGLDQTAPGVPAGGWQKRISADEMVATVIDTDIRDQELPWLVARTYFDFSPTPDWVAKGFDMRPIAARLADYVRSQAGGPAVTTTGVDVSSNNTTPNQPDFDWVRVAQSGRQFAASKSTQGTGYTNPTFARDWATLPQAGMIRHTYHYFQPGVDAAQQAYYHISVVGKLSRGDLSWLDIEDPAFRGQGDLSAVARAYLAVTDAWLGVPTPVYSYASFLEEHNLTPATIGPRPLILAAYQSQWPAVPAGWDHITIWQHADNASVPGIPTLVDEDYTPLTRDQLVALGYQGGQPAVDPAQTYYFQDGTTVNTTFALWTVALKPLYDFAQALKAQGDPMADLVMPGPLTSGETPTTWGPDKRPASFASLTNRKVGVYQDTAGAWHPYQLEL